MQKQAIMIFSFFSGCGLLDMGFENAGFRVSFVNEFNESFMDAYEYTRKDHTPRYGYHNTDAGYFLGYGHDRMITYMNDAHRHGSLVGFIGGPPCPDFSVAGKNMGKEGVNGKLSEVYIKLITVHKPDFFLFENVKGLWKTAKHRKYFEELKLILYQSGYEITEHLANALEYGVPQDRERIFLFGVHQNTLQQLHKDISGFSWNLHKQYDAQKVKAMAWPKEEPFIENSDTKSPENIQQELSVEYWFRKNNVLKHPNGNDYFIPRSGLARMQSVAEGDVSRKSYKRLHRWRYSPTAAYGNNEVHLHPYKARRLSVAEVLAIQSMPADFALPATMSLTDKFKTVGNGVPYLMGKGVAETIMDFLINCQY